MDPPQWDRLSLLKKGLYKGRNKVERGSLLEVALLTHDRIEKEKEYLQTRLLASISPLSKDDGKLVGMIDSVFYPHIKNTVVSEDFKNSKQLEYIKSLQGIDWTKILRF